MPNPKLLAIGLLLAGLTGCTAVRGTSQSVLFETEPAGATLKLEDKTYTTPAKVELKRKKEYAVNISKEGFRTMVFTLKAQWDGATLVDFAMPGGSAMLAVDTASGADRSFQLAKIKLQPSTDATTKPVEMILYRRHVLTQEQYQNVLAEEKKLRHDELFER